MDTGIFSPWSTGEHLHGRINTNDKYTRGTATGGLGGGELEGGRLRLKETEHNVSS